MIGAPFTNWDEVAGANYYTGLGSGEFWWLLLAIILCILALWWGHRHESEANASGVPMGGAAAGAGAAAPLMATSPEPAATAKPKAAPKPAAAKPAAKKKAPAKTKKAGPVRLKKAEGKADDLKEISGVGPKLEKTLNGLGFWHFHQIASWTKADVAIVDDELSFKGRIERDDWIKQAKALGKKK